MSFDLTRRTALFALMGLSACGFTPVYGPSGIGAELRGRVAIITPQSVSGFRIRDRLIGILGEAARPLYALEIIPNVTAEPATINVGGDTTRFNLAGTAQWTLADASGVQVGSGTVQTFTSYSATGSTVATQTAEQDARDRLSVALADLVLAQITLTVQATP